MFSIFESLIIFFRNIAIFGCFNVINKEIMQTGKARHLKILGRSKNEDSRGLKRYYIGRTFVPKFEDTF